jgi:hypothetical protein
MVETILKYSLRVKKGVKIIPRDQMEMDIVNR